MSKDPYPALSTVVVGMSTHEQLFEHIVALDEKAADWEFTTKLATHFEKLRKVRAVEAALDDVKNSEKRTIDSGVPTKWED